VVALATAFERAGGELRARTRAVAVRPGEGVVLDSGELLHAREVVVAAEVADSLTGDPVALALIGALVMGSIAALVFAAVGFLVSLVVSIAERLDDVAILRALGASRADVARWLALDTGLLLAFGLLSGAALGLVLSWLVLPYAALTQTGEPAVPPPVIVIPDEVVPVGLALTAALLLATSLVVRAQLRTTRVAEVLRRTGT
jgi:ABC-type antimicrobial peptide transport system permease subunit